MVLLAIAGVSSVASASLFMDDFEAYAAGSALHGQGGWKGWDNDPAWGAPASNAQANSGSISAEIGGNADLVHEFDVAGGILELSAMQYIPDGGAGENFFILLNQYNDGGPYDWSVQLDFNLGTGTVTSDLGGSATANIVYGQWVELKFDIDLDNNTIDEYYNGTLLSTHEWDDNMHGTLQCIDLFGNGASSIYYDDITVTIVLKARNPDPADGSNVRPEIWEENVYMVMDYTPGPGAIKHTAYFSDVKQDVIDRDGAHSLGSIPPWPSPTAFVVGYDDPCIPAFARVPLVPGTTYYWCIDEFDGIDTWPGNVWSFTTDAHAIVEDFEFYDWDRQLGADANWVYYVWVDGLANFLYMPDMGGNGTGANVFTQYDTVLGGLQAMRFDYSNNGFAENPRLGAQLPRLYKWSKAKAEIANLPSGIRSDWAASGIRALSIPFYGDSLNDVEPMWVELTDTTGGSATVTYGDHEGEDPNDITEASWQEWNIDLQDFSDGGVDLADVNSIAIGFGAEGDEIGGGYGFVYFDDIALYPTRCIRKPLVSEGNHNDDCAIDLRDFSIMAENFLAPGMWP